MHNAIASPKDVTLLLFENRIFKFHFGKMHVVNSCSQIESYGKKNTDVTKEFSK